MDASFVVVVVVGSRVASSSLVVIVPASPTVANCRRRSAAVGEVATAFRVARAPRSSLAPRLAAGRRIRSRARASDEFATRRGEARRGDRGSRANRIACVDDNSRVARVAVLNDIGVVGVVDVHFLDDDGFLLLLGRLGRHALGAALEIDGGLAR